MVFKKVKEVIKQQQKGSGYVPSSIKNQVFHLTDKRRLQLDKEFKEIDTNNDGILNKKEIEEFLTEKLLHHEHVEGQNNEETK